MRYNPIFERIERQNDATCVLLPFVSALPWIDEEVITKVFGQTMAVRNTLLTVNMPDVPPLSDYRAIMAHRKTRRAYWREKQQEWRRKNRKNGNRKVGK